MPELTTDHHKLLDYLRAHCRGAENAITVKHLGPALVMGHVRLREMIADLRDAGYVIGSQTTGPDRGYYLPLTYDEARRGVEHLRTRAREMGRRYAAQVRAIRRRYPPDLPPRRLPLRQPPSQPALPLAV